MQIRYFQPLAAHLRRAASIPASIRLLAMLLPLAACTSEQRRAEEDARMQTEAAQEVRRICDLPPAERQAELEKVRKESEIVVFCGSE